MAFSKNTQPPIMAFSRMKNGRLPYSTVARLIIRGALNAEGHTNRFETGPAVGVTQSPCSVDANVGKVTLSHYQIIRLCTLCTQNINYQIIRMYRDELCTRTLYTDFVHGLCTRTLYMLMLVLYKILKPLDHSLHWW